MATTTAPRRAQTTPNKNIRWNGEGHAMMLYSHNVLVKMQVARAKVAARNSL